MNKTEPKIYDEIDYWDKNMLVPEATSPFESFNIVIINFGTPGDFVTDLKNIEQVFNNPNSYKDE